MGNRLKEIRKERKLTREFLAEKIDVSSRFLADVEIGKVGISLQTLKKICKCLGVSADYLLGIVQEKDEGQEYEKIENLIKQMDIKYLSHLEDVITAFISAVEG